MALCVYVQFTLKPDKVDQFRKLAETVATASQKEPGNIAYDVGETAGEPNSYSFFEKWESQEAIELHETLQHYIDFNSNVRECLADKTVIKKITPIW